MNAGRILRRANLDTPGLRQAIWPVDPDSVNVWPASQLARLLWRKGVTGITQGRLVMVHPDVLNGDPLRLGRLVVHELVHVRQFSKSGYLRFMARYLRDHLSGRLAGKSGRDAYRDNPAEVEARAVTQQVVAGA